MEGKKVVKEMNKPQVMPVVGLPMIAAVLALGVAMVLGLLYSWLAAIAVFLAAIFAGRWIHEHEPKFIELLFLSMRLGTEYDPALLEDSREFPDAH